MEAVEKLSKAMPLGWGVTQSRWLKGGATVAFDNSPFAYHPPETAEDIVSGRLSHPLAEQVRNLGPGESVTVTERLIADLNAQGSELLMAMVRWAMRDGHYEWEYTLDGDMIIRRPKTEKAPTPRRPKAKCGARACRGWGCPACR